jgi:hypothetical protein
VLSTLVSLSGQTSHRDAGVAVWGLSGGTGLGGMKWKGLLWKSMVPMTKARILRSPVRDSSQA